MKRLFSFAIVSMIAMLSFAQTPAQVKKAATKTTVEKVMKAADMQKAVEMKAAMEAKAQAADAQGTSVLRRAAQSVAPAALKQMTPSKSIQSAQTFRPVQLGQYKMSQFKTKKGVVSVEKVVAPGKVKNVAIDATAPRFVAPRMNASSEIVATDASAIYYAEDGDWYCVLQAGTNVFSFDIVTNNPADLEINHEYTLADMDASFSYMKVGSTKYAYSSATFMPKQGQYGVDYEANCVLASSGDAYHITYTATAPETIDVEATSALVKFYGEPDNDWFVILSNENFELRFDIPNQSADGLILDHEYTLDDMLSDYSWGKNKATGESITYQSVSFKATTGANGTDYAATILDKKGNTYNVKYTTVAPPPTTDTVELEFTVAETDLVDAASTMGLIQFVGSKEDTGLEAYVGLHATQVAGEYTFEDVEDMYTSIYLDANDYTGVQCADLTGTVTDLGNGAYKAYFEYLGKNGTLYKLTYNYGEAQGGGGQDPAVVNKDSHGIITSVTGGVSKTYARAASGTVYFVNNSQLSMGAQSGTVTVIEDGDKVYIKDPIARFSNNTWVEGTKNGNQIVVSVGQPMYYSENYDATVSLRWGVISATGNLTAADGHADNFTYTVDGDTWTLDGTAAFGKVNGDAFFMGGFWDDDDSFAAGEAETILTYDPEYVEPTKDLVELPDGAQTAEWYMSATSVTSSSQTPIQNQKVNVAFVGDDVYVQGLFTSLPTAWVKGTKEGNTVTFKKFQYIGNYGGAYDMYFLGTDGQNMLDATATLAADAQTLTFTESLLANAATDRIYYLTWLENAVITAKKAEEPTITTLTAELPYANSFDTEAEQAEAAIYDANSDGRTFTFATPSGGDNTTIAARYTYSTANNGDDYVVFPGLTLVAGTSYKVSVDARSYGTNFPERFEVVAGTEAKASKLNVSVIPATEVASAAYATYTADFTPEADGVYYFAIHGISDADQFYLYTDNFAVKENNMNAPQAIADLTVTPDTTAALKATLEFTAPSKNLAGVDYPAETVCVLEVSRDGEPIDTFEVACGAPVVFVDELMEKPGTYTWSVTATINELTSDATKATAYVGEDLPMDVENLLAADKNTQVALTWDAVGELGSKGGIVKPENVTYNAYPVEMIEFFGMQFPSIDYQNPYATGIDSTSYNVDFNTNEGEQKYTYFGVTAENAAGETNGSLAALLTGAPYELPFVETLEEGKLGNWWGVDYDDNIYEAEGGIGIGQIDGTYGFVFDAKAAGWIELLSGKISTLGADKAQLSFNYRGAGSLKVIAYSSDKQANDVVLVPSADEQTATIDLSQFASEKWVRFTIRGEYEEVGQTAITNVIVMNMVDNDLAVTATAPQSIVAGGVAKVVATVKNMGAKEASDYSLKFYVNDEPVETPSYEYPTLQTMETASFEFPLETSVFDEAGDVFVKAEVVFAADEVADNNTNELIVSVVAPTATPVQSVVAEEQPDGQVKIDWTVSSSSAQEVTEDFESYTGNTIYADGQSCGPWAAVDKNPGDSYFWNSADILWPHWETPYAFGIINFEMSALQVEAVSGDQCLLFMSNTTPADKYMISSELPGVAQTITFQARPITSQYGAETFEVLASSTDTELTSFTKVASLSAETETWQEFSANLPEGTKYFAIRYTSNDIFGLFIDDLKYTVGGSAPTGFNIYVDEQLVATAAADSVTYTVSAPEKGNHKFSVTALYNNAESVPVSAEIATAINTVVTNSTSSEAYTISGIRMNATNLKRGVYVVNGKKIVK